MKSFDLELLRQGDEAEWNKVHSYVWWLVCSKARSKNEAFRKDATQGVMVSIIEHLDGIQHPRALPWWIEVTVTHQLIDDTRRARRLASALPIHGSEEDDEFALEEILAGSQDTFSSAVWKEQMELLWKIVGELADEHQKVFNLTVRMIMGDNELRDTDAIAGKLGITIDNYFQRWSRCKKAIRKHPRSKDLVYGPKKRV